jgi:hypothetical protein
VPKWTFENKITLGNLIQIGFIAFACIAGYFVLVGNDTAQAKAIGDIQEKIAPLAAASQNYDTRLTVAESNRAADQKQMDALESTNRELLAALQVLTVKLAETGRDVSYLRRETEAEKREAAE